MQRHGRVGEGVRAGNITRCPQLLLPFRITDFFSLACSQLFRCCSVSFKPRDAHSHLYSLC